MPFRKIALLVLFIVSGFIVQAQDTAQVNLIDTAMVPAKSKEDAVQVIAENIFTPSLSMRSLGLEFSLGKKICVNWHFAIGISTDDALYVHSPMGGAAGFYLLSKLTDDDPEFLHDLVNGLGILLFLIPEGIGYRMKRNEKTELIPYINPLGLDYMKKGNDSSEKLWYSTEVGGRAILMVGENSFMGAHAGLKYFYNNKFGIEAGLCYGGFF